MAKPISKKIEKTLKDGAKALEKSIQGLGSSKSTPSAAAMAGVAVAGVAGVAAAVHYLRKGPDGAASFHLVPNEDAGWAVNAEGADKPLKTFETKKDALEWAREMAAKEAPCELVIHNLDGKVQTSHSYETASA